MNTYPRAAEQFLETLREVSKLRLYLLTLVVQALTAGIVRKWLGQRIWLVLGWFLPLPLSPGLVGWLCMLGPLFWSLSAFWWPGNGSLWCRRVGAFHPSRGESRKIDLAFEALGEAATKRLRKLAIQVIDTADRFAFIRGITLMLSRGVVESDDLKPVLAHELTHAVTIDGRLMLALDRLTLTGTPLSRTHDQDTRREEGGGAAGIIACLRWILLLADGTLTMRALWPMWAADLRRRERAADAGAVALGQGPALAEVLKNWKEPTDRPRRRMLWLFNLQNHDRVPYRLDILLQEPPRPGEDDMTGFEGVWRRFCDWLYTLLKGPQRVDPSSMFDPAKRIVQTVFASDGMSEADSDLQAWVLAAVFTEYPVELTRSQLVARVRAVAGDATLPVEEAISSLALAHALDVGEDEVVALTEVARTLREYALA